ncbi:uncharacterized protein [Amphiura filiformis]|uniref:uncharacterized protein isoform X2 n=1 Tax=Amphiura filiformis TaxID=82378 RepID=UPI003B221DE1
MGFTGTECETDPIACPNTTVLVTNGAFSIPTPVMNFPVQDTNIIAFYWDSDNTTRQFGTKQMSQTIHSFKDIPMTVTKMGVLAFGTSSHTQASCEFTVQHVVAGSGMITCASGPCRNGGTCEDTSEGAFCTCPPGFSGVRCDRRSSGRKKRDSEVALPHDVKTILMTLKSNKMQP